MRGAPTPHLTPPQPQSKTQITTYGHVRIPPFQNNSRMDFHTFHTWSVIPVTRVTQRTLFCGAKNEKMVPQAKKFKIQDATQFPRCISWKEIYCLRQIYFLREIYFLGQIYFLREIRNKYANGVIRCTISSFLMTVFAAQRPLLR